MPEVFSRNTRHEKWHISKHLPLLCIATHMPYAHTSVKNRYPIFLMPVPSKEVFTFGNIVEQGLAHEYNLQGVWIGLR